MRLTGFAATVGFGALLIAAGCSSGGGSGGGGGDSASSTVAVRSASGQQVLVNSAGRTLYTSDQEKAAGKILCTTGDCKAIWTPLTVGAGMQPSAPADVRNELSVVKRPDGARQVAYKGAPLYTFSFDHAAGDVKGNGEKDSFGGTDFTWHAAAASGAISGGGDSDSTSGYGY